MELKKQKILFLDRDGTISYDGGAFGSEVVPYKEVIEMTKPFDGIKESLQIAKSKGYLLIVISNQAGIAKGRFDECDTQYSNKLLQEKLGGIIDGFYYCPHHTTGLNSKGIMLDTAKRDLIFRCDCRKPKTGMFLQCEKDLLEGKLQYIDERILDNKIKYEKDRNNLYKKQIEACKVDKKNSYMVGDKWIDVLAGEKYGVNPIFVMSGEGREEYRKKRHKYKVLIKDYKIYENINEFIKELK